MKNKYLRSPFLLLLIQTLMVWFIDKPLAEELKHSLVFDINELDLSSIERRQTTTWLPWIRETKTYEGYSLKEIIGLMSIAVPNEVTLKALDGYEVSISYQLLIRNEATIVDSMDGDKLSDSFGPYWLIMNQSRYPIVANKDLRKAMVWQLDKIIIDY